MTDALVKKFIKDHGLNTKIQIDEPVVHHFISTTLKLKKKHQELTEHNKNTLKQIEYHRLCQQIHGEARHLSTLLIKNKRWSFGKNTHFIDGKKILSAVGKLIKDDILLQSSHWGTNDQDEHVEKLLQLCLLQHSPDSFLNSTHNAYIKTYSRELNKINLKINGLNPSLNETVELKQLEQSQRTLANEFEERKLDHTISTLKNSWSRKLFGWLTGQNKQLADLMQIKVILPAINKQIVDLGVHITTSCQQKIILDNIHKFKMQLLNNELTDEKVLEIKNNMAAYLLSPNPVIKRAAKEFVQEIYASLEYEIKAVAITPKHYINTNTLRKKLGFFIFILNTIDSSFFDDYRAKIIHLIEGQFPYFTSVEEALAFLSILDRAAKISDVENRNDDVKIPHCIRNKLDQFNAWNRMQKLNVKLVRNQLTMEEMDDFYLNTVAMTGSKPIEKMQTELIEMLDILKYQILFNLNKLINDTHETEAEKLLKIRLHLFSLEKINIPNNQNMALLKIMRDELAAYIAGMVHKITSPLKLHQFTVFLENCWPDKLFCKHLLVKNAGNTPINLQLGNDLSENLVFSKEEAKGHKIAVDDVLIQPQESRMIRIAPSLAENTIFSAILKKRKEFVNRRIHTLHKNQEEGLHFLKSSDRSLLASLWQKITGNPHTELSKDNILKYGDVIIMNYFDEAARIAEEIEINHYMSNMQSVESNWIREEIAVHVDEIENALNININELLYKQEKERLDESLHQQTEMIDIGRMILQWKFINTYRIKYGLDSNASLQRAGMDIIYKMHGIVNEHPNFIYSFLGSLSETQLDTLEETFIDDPAIRLSTKGLLAHPDIIGDNEKIDYAGQTVLRKSILFFQGCELVKQELLALLNNEPINLALFQQHIAFVMKRLKLQADIEASLANNEFSRQFKHIFHDELTTLHARLSENEKNGLKENVGCHLSKLSTESNMISFIKSIPMNIVDLLSADFSSMIFQLKYFFANRFKNNIENMIKDNPIAEDKAASFKKLKGSNFYHFIEHILGPQAFNHAFHLPEDAVPAPKNWQFSQYVPTQAHSLFNFYQRKKNKVGTVIGAGVSVVTRPFR